MNNHNSQYDKLKCSYDYITNSFKGTAQDKCLKIADGFCNSPNHYINIFQVYYCWLSMNNPLQIALSMVAIVWLFAMINYVRRKYFVQPLMKLRKVLGVKSAFAEYVTIPLAYGISPLIVRLQGAVHDLDFGFNLGGTLGALYSLNAFSLGACAVVLAFSRKVDMGNLKFNLGFLLAVIILYGMISLQGYIQLLHGVIFIFGWALFIFFANMKEKKVKKSKQIFL